MGFITTSVLTLGLGSASVYSVLRHHQLRHGPRKMDWSGLVFAFRGRKYRNHQEKLQEFQKLLNDQKERLEKSAAANAASKSATAKPDGDIKNKNNNNNNSHDAVTTTSDPINSAPANFGYASPFDFSLSLPKIVAPNTIAALEYAQMNLASGVHVDVRVCKSGELVLFAEEFCYPTLQPSVVLGLAGKQQKKREQIMSEFKKRRVSDCALWELKEMVFVEEEELRLMEEEALGISRPKVEGAGEDDVAVGENEVTEDHKENSASTPQNEETKQKLNENAFLDEDEDAPWGEEPQTATTKNTPVNKDQEVFENWKKNRIITAEEAIKFCFENSLKLVMEVHIDCNVWGLPHNHATKNAAKQSRTKLINSILQFYSSNPLPMHDRDTTSLQKQREIRKWFEKETMIVSDDPWLLYKIRDTNWTIPAGIICRENWLEKRMTDRLVGYDAMLAGQNQNERNENVENISTLVDNNKKRRPIWARALPFLVPNIDKIFWQANMRLTPWLSGCSAIVLPQQVFTLNEIEKWRSRNVLVYWHGFGSDPSKFTDLMRYEASGESLLDKPEAKAQDALVLKKEEENPYAKWEFRTPELYKKKPPGGSCVVCDDEFIKFFPQSK